MGKGFADGPLAASFVAREPAATRAGMPPALARVGLTVSSQVGGAGVRNRVKRRLREAVRRELSALPPVDLVIVARSSAGNPRVGEVRASFPPAAARLRQGGGHSCACSLSPCPVR